jgi:hypothetical protein
LLDEKKSPPGEEVRRADRGRQHGRRCTTFDVGIVSGRRRWPTADM